MLPFLAIGGTACPADAAEAKTALPAAETAETAPTIVAPALRNSRRVVFTFEYARQSACQQWIAPTIVKIREHLRWL